jgi:hypothetical protein
MRISRLASLAATIVALCGCSEFERAIYVNCDLESAKGVSPTETDASEEAKIPWVRNVKSFTGKFPVGWTIRDGTFASLDVHVTDVADTKLKGTMKYVSTLVDQPDGSLRYDPKSGKLFEYTFEFNRLNNELRLMSIDTGPQNLKVHMLHFACRRVTP